VGYGLKVPLSTYYALPGNGQNVTLYVYTHIKEDSIQLFGFKTREEKGVFQRLLKIRGVGPKLSLNILSYLPISDLSSALEGIDFETLVAIPGVGKKMAERILFEVKGMIDIKPKEVEGSEADPTGEAKSALVNLGFPPSRTDNLVREVWNEDKTVTLETLIKKSLKRLTSL